MKNFLKVFLRFLLCILIFPIDFLRLTFDSWQYMLEGFSYRFIHKNPEQPCIYCRGCDLEITPRSMHRRIKYWNIWMLKILHRGLKSKETKSHIRKVAVCRNNQGYIQTPLFTPFIALFCTGVLAGLLFVLFTYLK